MVNKIVLKKILPVLLVMALASGCALFRKTQETVEKNMEEIKEQAVDTARKTVEQVKQGVKEKVKEQLDPQNVFGKDAIDIVYFGLDKNEERVDTLGSFRTDAIMVMHLDFANKKIGILSIPRDTYVPIANKNYSDKINHAFPFGGGIEGNGFQNSMDTISGFLGGVSLYGYFATDMTVIASVVDAIGGVEYEVDVEYTKDGYRLKKGLQILDGELAEQYVRFRKTANGDIDRVQRQQKFLLALFKQASQKVKVDEAMKIYNEVKDHTYTNLSIKEMMALGTFLKQIEVDSIECYYVKGSFMNKDGISYWKPDMEYVKEITQKLGLAEDPKSED